MITSTHEAVPYPRQVMPFPMRRLSPLLLWTLLATGVATWAGCDTLTPYDDGVVEGTFVLPDGTTGTFRTRAKAQAFRYAGLGTSDIFQFGTNNPFGADDPAEGPVADVTITQSGLWPRAGTFSPSFALDNPYPRIGASFRIRKVPGLHAEGVPDPSTAAVWFGPEGVVTVEVDGRWIRGTFDLWGHPVGTPDSVRVRVYGRFDTPWLGADD